MGDTRTDTPNATVQVHDRDGITVVEVAGEIDMASETPVRAIVAEQLDRRPAALVVDLGRVDFFGSAGIQLLIEAATTAQRRGVPLAVATDRRAVLRPLEITLVIEAVDVHPTVRDALAAVRPGARSTSRPLANQ
ncbi:anti-anti-sigma factor [Saccharothrix saharensis]|uniref:Anti-sigma factor antagonist n=1 Tax=Saccharothrix saharensis TaxID=571190 RepID=A0A543JQR3_9PSEU|nr:STAS domain-containing protein [Saccharothrix saharensis]TQM85085.1 anti-anti-sigma factor [Saccharothrix saharensis]